MKILKFLFVLSLIFVIASVSGCGKSGSTSAKKKIGVTLLTRGHLFYRDLEDGIRAAATKDGYEVIVTAAEFDLGKQLSQIEDFLSQKVDAIIVCPVDSRGVGQGIRKANEQNVPVFTADIAAQDGNVVSHVASDNVAGGRLAGEYISKVLGGKGQIAIINQPAITSVLDRVQGFKEALAKFPGMTIVADVNGQGVRDRSLEAASDALQAHPGINGIFGINDDSALGALDAVQQANRNNVVIVGYDANPAAADAIKKGTALKADVVQYPKLIGAGVIEAIHDYFNGKTPPKIIPIPVGIVDRDSLLAK